MKQRLLSVLAFASMTIVGMAQTWTEPVAPKAPSDGEPVQWVADGETSYYIKNVGCGQYLTGANSWATQISVTSDGAPVMKVVIEESGDGEYPDAVKIKVNGSFTFYGGNGYENGREIGNTYLFRDGETNGFIDHNNQACWYWNIEPSDNEGNFYIQSTPGMGGFNSNGDEYVVAQGAGQACLMNGANNDAMSEWQFINSEGVDLDALDKYTAALKVYEARLKLYNLYLDAVKYGANTDAASTVYNNADATVEELEAAYDELLKAMPAAVVKYAAANGSKDNPVEMPYVLYNADFGLGNINGWTIDKPEGATGNYQYQGAKYTSEDGNSTIHGFIESWVPAPNHLGDVKIYQKIGGLPNGHYILECDAMAVNQTNPDNDPDNAVEKDDYTGVYLYYSDGKLVMHGDALASDFKYVENEETGEGGYSSFPDHFVYEFDLSTTADSIMIGLMSEGTNLNWMGADNFVLKYAGETQSLPSYTALKGEIATSEAYLATEPEAQTAAIDALSAALTEAKALVEGGVDEAKDAQYQAAFTKLSEARAAVVASAAAYAKLNDFINKLNEDIDKYDNMANYGKMVAKIEALLTEMESAQDTHNLSAEEIEKAIADYDTMLSETVAEIFKDLVAANEPLEEPFEITDLFSNMSYPDANGSEQEPFPNGYPAENPVWMNETGTGNFKTNYGTAEVWNANFHIYRDFENLPKGKYTIQTKAFYRVAANDTNYPSYWAGDYDGGTYAYIYAGTGQSKIINNAEIASYEANTTGGASLETDEGTVYIPNSQQGASEIFTQDQWAEEAEKCIVEASGLITSETGTLRVGVKGENLEGNSWVIWYSWRLFYNGEDASAYDSVIEDLIAQAQELQPIVADAPAKLEAAIQAGQTAMDNDDKDGKVAAIAALNDAIKYANDGDALYTKVKEECTSRLERISTLEDYGNVYTNTAYPELLYEIDALDPDYDNAPQSLVQLQDYYDRMIKGWDSYVWSKEGIDDASIDEPVSMGEIIVNGTFANNDYAGWTIVNPETGAAMDGGTARDNVGEFWNSSVFDISQEVTLLKEGYWRLSVDGLFRAGNTDGEITAIKNGTQSELLNELYLYVWYPNFYKEVKIMQWSDFERGALIDNDENVDLISIISPSDSYNVGTEEEPSTFYAPNTQGELRKYIDNSDRYHNFFDFGYPKAGTAIKIGLTLRETCSYNWCPFTNFDLEYLGKEMPDAVNGVAASTTAATEQIFSIDGRQKNTISRGINIVRMSDGSVRKVLVK